MDGGLLARLWLVVTIAVLAVLLALEINTDIDDWLIFAAVLVLAYLPVLAYFSRDQRQLPQRDPAPQDELVDDRGERSRAEAAGPDATSAPTL